MAWFAFLNIFPRVGIWVQGKWFWWLQNSHEDKQMKTPCPTAHAAQLTNNSKTPEDQEQTG